jgi:hypothetical protein
MARFNFGYKVKNTSKAKLKRMRYGRPCFMHHDPISPTHGLAPEQMEMSVAIFGFSGF